MKIVITGAPKTGDKTVIKCTRAIQIALVPIPGQQPYNKHYISPHCVTTTGSLGLLLGPVGTFSIFLMTNKPSMTFPNTTCFPSRKSHFAHVIKNWQPLVFCPLFAIESNPGESCFSLKFSSANEEP